MDDGLRHLEYAVAEARQDAARNGRECPADDAAGRLAIVDADLHVDDLIGKGRVGGHAVRSPWCGRRR